MRAWLIVLILVARAGATPDRDARAWRDAAAAYYAIAANKTAPRDERVAAARAGWAALENALAKSPPPPPDPPQVDPAWHTSALDADDRLLTNLAGVFIQLEPDSPDALGATFLSARTFRRHDQLDEADMLFMDLVRLHPEDRHAEEAASFAIEALIRQQRYDELASRVAELLANKVLMRTSLREKLQKIEDQLARKRAEQLERTAHESKDLAAYDRCGEAYLALAKTAQPYGDELLYNALVCFQEGRSPDKWRPVAKRLLADYPRSKLAPRTLGRIGFAESLMANYEIAAAAFERMAQIAPKEKDASDGLSDAAFFRIALGQLDRAEVDLALAEKLGSWRGRDAFVWDQIRIAEAQLAAGHRAAAIARAKAFHESRQGVLARAKLLAELACPVALVDELCPRPRDRELAGRALRSLRSLAGTDDPTYAGHRIALDLELEAKTDPNIASRYRDLANDDGIPAETRIIAHLRLARLAKQLDETASELEQCILLARDHLTGLEWMKTCERERSALPRPAAVSPVLEQIGAPLTRFEPSVEAEPVRTNER